jgi:hypothetical protein
MKLFAERFVTWAKHRVCEAAPSKASTFFASSVMSVLLFDALSQVRERI